MALWLTYNGMIGETGVCALVEADTEDEARAAGAAAFRKAELRDEIVEAERIELPAVGEAFFEQ